MNKAKVVHFGNFYFATSQELSSDAIEQALREGLLLTGITTVTEVTIHHLEHEFPDPDETDND